MKRKENVLYCWPINSSSRHNFKCKKIENHSAIGFSHPPRLLGDNWMLCTRLASCCCCCCFFSQLSFYLASSIATVGFHMVMSLVKSLSFFSRALERHVLFSIVLFFVVVVSYFLSFVENLVCWFFLSTPLLETILSFTHMYVYINHLDLVRPGVKRTHLL